MSKSKKEITDINFGGTNIFMVLQLIFLTLKLAGLVTWSWWFVLTPIIVEVILVINVAIIAYIILKVNGKI